jgi:uncharacterized protein (TIGR03084 family)
LRGGGRAPEPSALVERVAPEAALGQLVRRAGQCRQLTSFLDRAIEHDLIGDLLVEDAEAERRARVEELRAEHEAAQDRGRQLALHHRHCCRRKGDADFHLRQPELSRLADDAVIAAQRHDETTGDRMTVHGHHHRPRELVQGREEDADGTSERGLFVRWEYWHDAKVRAGGEESARSRHHDGGRRLGDELFENGHALAQQLRAERIRGRVVHLHHHDVAAFVEMDQRCAHRRGFSVAGMPAPDLAELCTDLTAEHADLDALVAPLDASQWDLATPAEGWTIRDQIHHLAWFDRNGVLAIEDPDGFQSMMNTMVASFATFESELAGEARAMSAAELLQWWREQRADIVSVLRAVDPALRIPWYGPPMSAASFVTARLMETWAHGQDVADALGRQREPTVRLRHIAHIGVRTRGFSYAQHDMALPQEDVRVELAAPDGTTWTWGSDGASDRVTGPALDFCLVVTQRRHVADTALRADGPLAAEWLSIAQAFAGSPGAGRRPGLFA